MDSVRMEQQSFDRAQWRKYGDAQDGFNLSSGSSGSTIRGFIINRFTGDGIEINSSNNNTMKAIGSA